MFRVGRSWRASKESLKRFEQAQFDNNRDYPAVLTHKRQKKLIIRINMRLGCKVMWQKN